MRFEEALIELRKGKKIRRKFKEFITVLYLKDSYITYDDLFAEDWEVIEEPGKTFPEVFESFKDGKRIRRKIWWEGQAKGMISTKPGTISIDDLLATDWEICE